MSAEALFSTPLVSPRASRVELGWMFPLSLALHLIVLLVLSSLQISSPRERALTTYHVSLVTLPSPGGETEPLAPQPVELGGARSLVMPPAASPAEAKPAPPLPPAPASVQKASPKMRPTAPKVAPMTSGQPAMEISEGPKPTENLMREVLRDIELPPQAPTLGRLKPVSPTTSTRRPQAAKKEIDALLGQLTVPTESIPSEKVPTPMTSEDRSRPSLSEEVSKQLQKIQPPTRAPRAALTPQASPLAKSSALSRLEAKIEVAGNPGASKYLVLVQSQISRQWVAPQVDLTGRSLQVVVRFRLHRSGEVSNLSVEKPSGNGYYDDAGLRAVMAAIPLPPFPSEMAEVYLDTHFTFTVGERTG